MFAYGQTGSGKTFTVSGLERLVAELLFDGDLEGERKLFVCIIELAGNSASGKMPPSSSSASYIPTILS
jgi:kinesin family protein 2/24